MRSNTCSSIAFVSRLGFIQSRSFYVPNLHFGTPPLCSPIRLKMTRFNGTTLRRRPFQLQAMDMDDDGVDVSSFHDWDDINTAVQYVFSSSEGEDSDGDALQPITDFDPSSSKEKDLFHHEDDSITSTTRLARARKRRKTIYGVLNNIGVMSFSIAVLSIMDLCAWRIIRLPLAPLYLLRPFLTSIFVVSCAGYISVPLFRTLKLRAIIRRGPAHHYSKKGTPTTGGLYFIPLGILVAEFIVGYSSTEVRAVSVITLLFAGIGLLDDILRIKVNKYGLSFWTRILLEVTMGTLFSFWMSAANVSSPYSMYTLL